MNTNAGNFPARQEDPLVVARDEFPADETRYAHGRRHRQSRPTDRSAPIRAEPSHDFFVSRWGDVIHCLILRADWPFPNDMTMPHARKIVLDGHTYPYVLKGGHHNLIGWSAKTLRLVIEIEPEKYVSNTFTSKTWTDAHEENADNASVHKASFMPSDVKAVINALEDNSGSLPEVFELPSWKLVPKP